MVSPKAERTNSLMHHKSCAFIYSSKAFESDKPLINVFGLSLEEIERAREIEDVIQFVFRGDLRNPNSTDDYGSTSTTGIRPRLWPPISPSTDSAWLNSFLLKKPGCST